VVDGRPGYHLGQCPLLDDVPAGAVPERVPLAQAVEDGFGACPTCRPTEERVAAGSAAVVGDAAAGWSAELDTHKDEDAVWVVDGRPRYHRPGCAQLAGVPAEPIPRSQARTDGFTPCPRCDPESGRG
jgi:methylphosphotriester-DNA--protein-cysteine methyltransferase